MVFRIPDIAGQEGQRNREQQELPELKSGILNPSLVCLSSLDFLACNTRLSNPFFAHFPFDVGNFVIDIHHPL